MDNIICEGDYSNPTKLIVDNQEINLNIEKWNIAYKTINEDMGMSKETPNFLSIVYDMYNNLI